MQTRLRNISSQLSAHNILLALFFVLLLFLGFWRLPYSPATWFDEGINMGIAKSFIEDGVFSLKTGPGQFVEERSFLITSNYPLIIPVAISLKFFGLGIGAARVPMILYMLLFCASAYLFVRKIYGNKEAALWTLALIISFIPFYGNGKAVLGEVPGLSFLLLGVYALCGVQNVRTFFVSGILIGLSVATKPFFILALPAVSLYGAYRFLKHERGILMQILAFIVGLIPPVLLYFFVIMPEFSMAALRETLGFYANSYAEANLSELILGNALRFFRESTPLHFLLLFVAFVFSLIRRFRKGESLQGPELLIFGFILLNVFWYLKTPGWYRYFFPAHLLLFLFFPFALFKLIARKYALVILTLLVSFQAFLFIKKLNEPLYLSREVQDMEAIIQERVDSGSDILMINSPSLAFSSEGFEVYQYLQINPVLHFGADRTVRENGDLFSYIVLGTSPAEIKLADLESLLLESYTVTAQSGHYILYERN